MVIGCPILFYQRPDLNVVAGPSITIMIVPVSKIQFYSFSIRDRVSLGDHFIFGLIENPLPDTAD